MTASFHGKESRSGASGSRAGERWTAGARPQAPRARGLVKDMVDCTAGLLMRAYPRTPLISMLGRSGAPASNRRSGEPAASNTLLQAAMFGIAPSISLG